MARLPYLHKGQVPGHPDLPRSETNISRALANSPGAARNLANLALYIRHESRLDPRLRELAILQVGYVTRSEYEYAHHCALCLEFGASEDDIRAVADETAGRPTKLDALTRVVLRAARELTIDIDLSEATFAELRRYLTDEHLLDLFTAICNYNSVVRLLSALRIDLEDDYRKYLVQFPLKPA